MDYNEISKKVLEFLSKAKKFTAEKSSKAFRAASNVSKRVFSILMGQSKNTFNGISRWWKEYGHEATKNTTKGLLNALKGLLIVVFLVLWKTVSSLLQFLGHIIKKLFKGGLQNKKSVFRYAGYGLFVLFVVIASLFVYYSKDLPSSDSIGELFVPESTKIIDRTESNVLYDIYGEQKRTVVKHEEIPDDMRFATIIAEDENFYHHSGIDFTAIIRAMWVNIKGGEIEQGGSTITQQFIKNALLTPERTFSRKIKEAVLAIELEWRHSKDEILNLYLNQVPYGSNAYGVEAAAKTYFGKSAEELTTAESATLASLTKAPTFYLKRPAQLDNRRDMILRKMKDSGYIQEDTYQKAKEEKVVLERKNIGLQAPHFVMEVKERLEQKYGKSYVQRAGLRVITTLDTTLQNEAKSIIEERAEFNSRNFNANNTSLVAIDPKTGQILAMVGSKDYFGDPTPEGCVSGQTCRFDPQVNVATTPQQPGSSFKPFAYAKAFQKGYTPETTIYDVPTEFNSSCNAGAQGIRAANGSRCYNPQNYDQQFFGPLPMKEALAQSRNIPAVKTLYLASVEDTLDLAKKMGINSLGDSSRYGLSLVLGGGDVKPLEEISAFGAFANKGEYNPYTYILRVEDKEGNVLEEYQKNSRRVLEEDIAEQINHVLSTNSYRVRAFGQRNNLVIPGLDVAAKTGTTQRFRDAWTVGYTKSLVAGVWVGNNNNDPMYRAPGSSAAAPIWNSFISNAYEVKQEDPENMKEKEFYFNLPTKDREQRFTNPHIPETGKPVLDGAVEPHSILHYVYRDNPEGRVPDNPENNPQYQNWETAVRNWAKEKGIIEQDEAETKGSSSISFTSPDKSSFSNEETLPIEVQITKEVPIRKVSIYLEGSVISNNTYGGNARSISITDSVDLDGFEEGSYTLRVEVRDKENDTEEASLTFSVEEE